MMKLPIFFLLGIGLLSGQDLTRIGTVRLPKGAGEILAVDGKRKLLVTTRHGWRARGLEFIDLSDISRPRLMGHVSLKGVIPGGIEGVSSVAIDPVGRGFAVAAILPKDAILTRGRIAIIDLDSRQVVGTAVTGYHPDCVIFSADGRYLTVACEGEWQEGKANTPGSLTIYDIPRTKDWKNLRGVDVPLSKTTGARLLHGQKNDLEPEYITIEGSRAYVTLQENNALGIFDLKRRTWLSVRSFGSWPVRMDVSDRDGAWGKRKIQLKHDIHALPMPDTLSSFIWKGKIYLATANEGDKAGFVRVKHLGKASPPLDPEYRARLKNIYGIDPQHDSALGRLQVSPIDGDLDRDGDIDRVTALGTRSFSIWEAASGKRVYDSGSLFAEVGARDAETFNVNRGRVTEWDTRSDNRGAEPEAIYAEIIGGRPLLVVATERQSGVYLFDCRNPAKPRMLSGINELRAGHSAPESALLLPASKSPTGRALCMVGWEGSNSVTFYELSER
jgi:DNA-binding beta-propeller fold protein YncE